MNIDALVMSRGVFDGGRFWEIPAFAGMTEMGVQKKSGERGQAYLTGIGGV